MSAQQQRLDAQAVGTVLFALLGLLVLPWYAIEEGFWSTRWLLGGYPLDSVSAPALFLWFKGASLWLLPMLLLTLAALAAALARPAPATLGRVLVALGVLGIAYMLAQGFLFGLRGWNAQWLNDWLGETEQRQFGMGYGALFVGVQGWEWSQLLSQGLTMTSSNHGAFFYLIVGTHGLHVIAGLTALLWGGLRLRSGTLTRAQLNAVQIFWTFVVGLWPIIYGLVYL